ncbi:hypothetical protein D9M68_825160 [compost metagenome]
MKGAAQAVGFNAAEGQVGAAVRAVAVEQAVAALCVAEQHEVLPEHAHGFGRSHGHARVQHGVEFVEQRHGLPVAAQQFTTGGAGPDLGQALVEFGFHGCSGGCGSNGIPFTFFSVQFAP